ncbi:MAG TPA: MBL fold metallo-hydrolase [Burkholderiaceae bacterium]|nr:MBL fold metallo-hydrolase [Burkholderiaceae bacterium]
MTAVSAITVPTLPAMRVLERGWVSSNNVLLFDDDQATLIDTGYVTHGEQTLQLVRHSLGNKRLARIINTHLHSDHCGGNALLRRELGATIAIPPGHADAVERWDEGMLGFSACGQACDRFSFDAIVRPGARWVMGDTEWQAFASPGHDPHSIVLWNADHRVLISADALWEHGFGVIFPEIEGNSGFTEQRAILALIEKLQPHWVVPGHGAPFTDVSSALARAFARLKALEASPERNARSAIRTLIKFHLMIVRQVALDKLVERCSAWAYARIINERYFRLPFAEFIARHVNELAASGALQLNEAIVANRE